MYESAFIAIGFLLGGGAGVLACSLWARRHRQEQQRFLDDATARLKETFDALAGNALKGNSELFLGQAKRTLDTVLAEAKGDVARRQEAIDALIKPIAESLKKYEEHAASLEASRQKAYGSIEEQLKSVATAHQQLQQETGKLVTALRRPEVRGKWGEVMLRNAVELIGMSEHCDFTEQASVDTDESRLRPDMLVHLPGNRQIVVDAKTPFDAYLDALATESDEARKSAMKRHAEQVRRHMEKLAAKSYWQQFDHTPEIVVMFLSPESSFVAALDHDPALFENAISKGVVIATPATLIALLRTIAFGWQQERIAQNAEKISDLGKELHTRLLKFCGDFTRMRSALERATNAYNEAVGSLERRVLATARKFKELGAAAGDELPSAEPIETIPRVLNAPDVPRQLEGEPPGEPTERLEGEPPGEPST